MSTSPFEWRKNLRPSIFASDPAFTAKANGKTTSQMASEQVDAQRKQGKSPGTMYGLGNEETKYDRYREHQMSTRPENLVAVHSNGPKGTGGDRAKAKKKSTK